MRKTEKKKSIFGFLGNWQVRFAFLLIVTSAIIYVIHFELFHDLHHILVFLVEDIAFIPIEVLIVTLIIHRLLESRDKKAMLQKLNMVIGTFYSEMGNALMAKFAELDPESGQISKTLRVSDSWTEKEFAETHEKIGDYNFMVEITEEDVRDLKGFLVEKRTFLLGILQNPNLLEHEYFTDLLWAVFHITEELMYRDDFQNAPEDDLEHLAGDIKRAYVKLVGEWLYYMKHLQEDYPYLFSLAIRTNPFETEANATIGK